VSNLLITSPDVKPLLPAGVLVHHVCKALSLLSFTVFVGAVCVSGVLIFSEGR